MTLRAEKVKKALIALLVCLTAMSGFFVVETALADTAYATTYYTYGYSFKYYDVNNSLVTKTALTFKSSTKSTSSAVAVYNASQTRANCTFKGWSTNVAATSGATTVSNARNKKTKPTTSNTYGAGTTGHRYYAIWQPSWSLAKSLGVAGAQESKTLAVTARANPSYALTAGDLTDASATGYTFDGWYRDASYATAASAGQVIYNSATIYAKWIENEYKVLFDGNGANSNVPGTAKRKYTENYTIPAHIPTKLGSTFVCWNTKADGSGTDYMPGDTISDLANTEKELKLFAKWNMHVDLLTTEALTLQASDAGEIAGSKFYILNQSDFNVRCKELSFVPENGWTCVETTEDMPKDSKKIGLKCTSQGGHEMKTPITDVLITDEETKGFRFTGKAALSNKGFIRERVGTMVSTIQPDNATEEAKTILYSDGTLIINEPVSIHSANMLLHGAVTAEYDACKETTTWNSSSTVPWVADTANRDKVKNVEFGSKTKPNNMAYWFYGCTYLESLDSTNLDTSNAASMKYTFNNAGNNANGFELDLSEWAVSNAKDMSFMFSGCKKVTAIYASSDWKHSGLTSTDMFKGCESLIGGKGTAYDANNVDATYAHPDAEGNPGYFTYKKGEKPVSTKEKPEGTYLYSDGTLVINELKSKHSENLTSHGSVTAKYAAYTKGTIWNSETTVPWVADTANRDKVKNVEFGSKTKPDNMAYWFSGCKGIESLDSKNLDTSDVRNMSYMFYNAGYDAATFKLDLSSWNTANVTDMSYMFCNAGYNAATFNLDISGWEVSNAADMSCMFSGCRKVTAIYASSDWKHSGLTSTDMFKSCESLIGGNGTAYDANNVDAAYAHPDAEGNPGYFTYVGPDQGGTILYSDGTLVINELGAKHATNLSAHGAVVAEYAAYTKGTTWYSETTVPWVADTANRESIKHVEFGSKTAPNNMEYWFYDCKGLESLDSTNLDTSNVKRMSYMFGNAGYNAATFNLDIGGWDVSQVTRMVAMFYNAGYSAATFNLDLSSWNTSNVTDMSNMFAYAGYKATTWDIGDLGYWTTSVVTDMNYMFYGAGKSATTWDIGDLSSWNTARVTDMSYMFKYAGYSAATFNLDLSGWNTEGVERMDSMFEYAGYSATTWSIGDVSNWDVSFVFSMEKMFRSAGHNSTIWDIGELRKWRTNSATNMDYMFFGAGESATTYRELILYTWSVSDVTRHSNFRSVPWITEPAWKQ